MKRLSEITEGLWDGIVRRGSTGEVRKEDETEFLKYLHNVKWVDVGSSKYLYAQFDFPYSEYHKDGCNLNEIIEIQKKLPKDVHIMTRSNLNYLKKNGIQFREINTDIRRGCSISCGGSEKIYFSSSTFQSRYNWCDYVVAYILDHPLDDYCVSVNIELYGRNRNETNRFLTTPKNVLTVNIKDRTDNIFTQKCCGFKLIKNK